MTEVIINEITRKNQTLYFLTFEGRLLALEPRIAMTTIPLSGISSLLMFQENIGQYFTPNKEEILQSYKTLVDNIPSSSVEVSVEALTSDVNS